ncbi:hypothetical protein HYU14_00925 [Candidatus Woesearchaeota archaeon]|nr:hypothetical protein [Candidatus Woesearchaeota archaeon]
MGKRPSVIKPDSRENKTTIQVTKDIKDTLAGIGSKGESYNQIIEKLITNFEKHASQSKGPVGPIEAMPSSGQIKIGKNVMLSKYERITISIKDASNAEDPSWHGGPPITLEAAYNKPFKKEEDLYQIDLKINKVIFDNEIYSPKEFFGVLQKDMVYCKEFVYYYLRSIVEVLKIEFKKSNYFFGSYGDYFDLSRWRTLFLNSRLSPEILSADVESVLSDLNNERTNSRLLEDVRGSYYRKIKGNGSIEAV